MTGIIFDFNGTLFDDSDKVEKSWQLFSTKQFHRNITPEEFKEMIHGRNNEFILQHLSETELSHDQITEFINQKEAIYRELCETDANTRLTGDVLRLLDDVKERGIPRTIATASPKVNVDYFIVKFGLEKWFNLDKIIYNDGTIPGKPAPDFYIRAAKSIGIKPENCIVIEDAVSGIQSAHNAGIGKIIAITSVNQQHTFEKLPGVYEAITSFDQFDRLLLRG